MADDQMDDMELGLDDDYDASSPSENTAIKIDETDEEKQLRVLNGYISSLPYPCESIEDMEQQLRTIVVKMTIAAEGRHWEHFFAWDGILASWMSMKYPLHRETRAALAQLYWELLLTPAMEPKYTHAFASSLSRLIGNRLGSKRKLEIGELTLPWESLWEVMKPEVWPRKRAVVSTRNLHNIFLHVAATCSDYFLPSEIPQMMDTFLPLFTQETASTVFSLLTAFLPASHAHQYLPFLFKTWEAFHSYKIEDGILSVLGTLSVSHVAGKASDFGPEGSLEWKDIGIYTEDQWVTIMRSCLASMNVPVGNSKGGSSTAQHADRSRPSAFKKASNRYSHFAQIIIYSISVDAPIRESGVEHQASETDAEKSYLAGSKALDSLDRLITSVETYFHPSNYGVWSYALTAFVHRLASEFSARWNDELTASCKTPVSQRLTPAIKTSIVEILRTPVLLSMFSKDPVATTYAQAAMKHLTILEPELVMPQLLERAYGGLETINETHRTTAAIGTLAAVPSPLTMRSVWPKGQKNLVPLLELCLPGIDINDALKTVSTSLFIVTALQFVKIGDLNVEGGVSLGHDAPAEDVTMLVDGAETPLKERGVKAAMTEEEIEEDIMVKHSTAGFADWVVSFFRRVFALYENLPEEGGRSGKTGGKSEETILKSLNSALDIVCANMSDQLFELALNLVFDYCTTNARSNSVRSIGNLVNSMARTRPRETIAKFLPFTKRQIEVEIAGGASTVRTTSNSATPVPSDTTFHWNLAIIRAALAYGGRELLNHKSDILELFQTLRAAKNERGYSGFGRMVSRTLATLTSTYTLENRPVNPRQWNDPYFERSHHHSWGRQFSNPKDVEVRWHVPSDEEIAFALEIINQIVEPTLTSLEKLTDVPVDARDAIWRNDFCRMLYLVRSAWSGMSTMTVEGPKVGGDPCIDPKDYMAGLTPESPQPAAGFALTDVEDPRHKAVTALRERFGRLLHRSCATLTQEIAQASDAADSVDASIQLVRALDVHLLDYGVARDTVVSHTKHFSMTRDLIRTHPKQRSFPRVVWVKRAMLYHYGRMLQHGSYRSRSAVDDQLLFDLVDLSLSPYTRLRKHAQSTVINACSHYRRGWRLVLPRVIQALEQETAKGANADPDRQKGALHILADKTVADVCCSLFPQRYILAVLRCQSQEKPSIQKLVATIIAESLSKFTEETVSTTCLVLPLPGLSNAIKSVRTILPIAPGENAALEKSLSHGSYVVQKTQATQQDLISSLLAISEDPKTHWRYKEYAVRYIYALLSRDYVVPPAVLSLFMANVNSEHPTMRSYSHRAITKALLYIKIRSFSNDSRQLWLGQWTNPLRREIEISDPASYLDALAKPMVFGTQDLILVDKEQTGFLTWAKTVKGYVAPPLSGSSMTWSSDGQASLKAVQDAVTEEWLDKFVTNLSQESSRAHSTSSVDLRLEVIVFVKSLFKMFESKFLEPLLIRTEPLLLVDAKYKQRAGFEILTGLLMGSKHWSGDAQTRLWTWVSSHLPGIFDQIKPDTVLMWDSFVTMQLGDRDPRRNQPLLDFINSQSVDFGADSAFAITKRLTTLGTMQDALGYRLESQVPTLMKTYFDNVLTPYAEVRAQIAVNMGVLIGIQWHPRYRTPAALLSACSTDADPLQIRKTDYMPQIQEYIGHFAQWRLERLPPPRVSQSTYDRVGLSLLQWIWGTAHSVQAASVFPYLMPLLPEIFKMAELNDSSELQLYSAAVLNILSAIAAPLEFVELVIDSLIDAVKSSPSWRIRLSVLPVLQVFYFRNLLNLSDASVKRVLSVLLECLRDENVEVRETAAKTLSGVIRCSQRQSILPLKDRFTKLARKTKIPKRGDKEALTEAIRTLHSAVLGLCALLDAYPYSVEPWGPGIIETLSRYSSDPVPISTSIRKCAASFKQTHQDTWAMDQHLFNEDQIQALATIVSGTSYYA